MPVSIETRSNIADAFLINNIKWNGRLSEADFLSRIFDLKSLWSNDERYSNAYQDIQMHRGRFIDWEDNWIFTDNRLNLFHIADDLFLRFLCEILHPAVRPDQVDENEVGKETQSILTIFNYHLSSDNIEIVPRKQPIGKPFFEAIFKEEFGESITQKQVEIIDYLSSDYVRQQVEMMEKCISSSPHDAIGKSKELIETICKSVLERKGLSVDKNWTLPKLVKEANNSLQFIPQSVTNYKQAEQSMNMIIQGISNAVHGITELRNNFGSGHGHSEGFQGLDNAHARMSVGFATEFARFYLEMLKRNP